MKSLKQQFINELESYIGERYTKRLYASISCSLIDVFERWATEKFSRQIELKEKLPPQDYEEFIKHFISEMKSDQ